MKFEAYVRRLRFAAMFQMRRKCYTHPKYSWIAQDQSIKRTGGELLNPCVVCGSGRIQGPWA